MSVSYRKRQKARQRAAMVDGEKALRRKMRKDPISYPRWICGLKLEDGELLQKVFPKRGTYTGKGHGRSVSVVIVHTYPMISTIAWYRQSIRK